MANNFKILKHRTNGDLCLQLKGDFDGTSAFELANMLNENLDDKARVSINTKHLKKIFPFGRQVFSHEFSRLRYQPDCVRFLGDYASQITSNLR
jgi:hypothetical protein